jgi:hypothetical protein
MKHHEIKSLPAGQVSSFPERTASDQEEFATLAANLGAQQQRFQQLNEFCERAIAEIRASLERSENVGKAAPEQKKPVGHRRFASRSKSARAA